MNSRTEKLNLRDYIAYLGVKISHGGGGRKSKSWRARLQQNGVIPCTCHEIFSTGDNSVLTYGCASLFRLHKPVSD